MAVHVLFIVCCMKGLVLRLDGDWESMSLRAL
uniref:Uncharacterized protein n=1 Tax=Rhizophora mucronata TaxID=61149 RepID=A0A2P2NHQ7_RHIMU